MSGARSRYGLLVSALGAVLLAVAVFLPWYGISFTPAGVAAAQHEGQVLAQELGNSPLQSQLASQESQLAGLTGHEITAVSAHQVLSNLNVVLIVLAVLALLDALVPLARASGSVAEGAGRALVVLGCVAALCVGYRMVHPPPMALEGLLALKLREGCWLALFGSVMIALGGIWPRSLILRAAVEDDAAANGAFAALSGWTPGS